jgi:Amiloride-sensitive sodium channel
MNYHMPNEVKRNENMYYFTLETSANMIITPKVMMTSEDLRHYSPTKRKCYFSNERHLKYFKHYTQRHCEMECKTDAILKKCGCLPLFIESKTLRLTLNCKQKCTTNRTSYFQTIKAWIFADRHYQAVL